MVPRMGSALQSLELTGLLMVIVYQKPDDPYLTDLVVGIVTRMGTYLNQTQARHMIGQGKVVVDGKVRTDPSTDIRAGIHEFQLDGKKIVVEVRDMETL